MFIPILSILFQIQALSETSPLANTNHNAVFSSVTTLSSHKEYRNDEIILKCNSIYRSSDPFCSKSRTTRLEVLTAFQNFVLLNLFSVMEAKAVDKEEMELDECKNGAIVSEGAVPGAYQNICMSLSQREIQLKSTGDKIVIIQGTNSREGGRSNSGTVSGRTGVAIWNSCLLLTRLMDALVYEAKCNIFQEKTVMELGCGTGLASIVAARLGAKRVIATDGNEEVVELARTNVVQNNLADVIEVSSMKWGLLGCSDYYETADVIIGSDLSYNPGSWRVLAETLRAVLKPGGIILYLTLGHSGFSVSGELSGFLSVAETEGLIELKKGNDYWNGKKVPPLNDLLQKSMNSNEKLVTYSTGGVQAIFLTAR